MVSLLDYLQSAWSRVRGDFVLLALPVVGTVLQFENVRRVLAAGSGGGVNFRFPSGFATLWSFAQVPPADGVVVNPGAFAVGVLAQALLTAVYVPRAVALVRPERGEREFATALSRYFAPLFGVALFNAAVGVALVVLGLVAGPLVLLAVPVVLLVGYALYAAPFLVVVADESAVGALSRSVERAADGGAYASFGGQYLLLVVVVSVPVSIIVRLGVAPLALATVAVAPLAATTVAATAAFVADLVGGEFDGDDTSDDGAGRPDAGARTREDQGLDDAETTAEPTDAETTTESTDADTTTGDASSETPGEGDAGVDRRR